MSDDRADQQPQKPATFEITIKLDAGSLSAAARRWAANARDAMILLPKFARIMRWWLSFGVAIIILVIAVGVGSNGHLSSTEWQLAVIVAKFAAISGIAFAICGLIDLKRRYFS